MPQPSASANANVSEYGRDTVRDKYDGVTELTELMHGARALAIKVWNAGWRPALCALCGHSTDLRRGRLCGPCELTAYTLELGLYPDHGEIEDIAC